MRKPPLYPTYPISTLRELVLEASSRYGERVALQSKKHGTYQPLTYRQLLERVRELATAFFRRGLRKGEMVALIGENRTEWALTYLATVSAGLVTVPIDRDLRPREIRHILSYCKAGVLVGSKTYLGCIREMREHLPSLATLISMEDQAEGDEITLAQLLQEGYQALREGDESFQRVQVEPQDLAAVIFTSGTTGGSKAVMLSHGNLASNVIATSQAVSIRDGDVLLSILPLHHTYECTCGFLTALYQGATICHAENLRRIPENLAECRASVILGVPLVFEAMYRKIRAGIQEKGEGKFRLARNLAGTLGRLGLDVRRRLFRPLHERFGGRLRLLISGGAAVNPQVARGFRELGIDFIQGYGMTEASPLISVNRVSCFKDESVGLPIPGVEVRIVDGEIVVRGPNVMKGYYLNSQATQEVLRDGWLHTGDLGYLDQDGFLYVQGRKKSVIVTPNGKNVYPEEVEAILNESPFILESLVWGGPESDPAKVEVQAIVVPNRETFDKQFGSENYDEEKIRDVIGEEIKRLCRDLAPYKRVRKFTLRDAEFEKTTTRKIRRYLYTSTQEPVQSA